MATVEHLYKAFGVLADAKEKAGEVRRQYLHLFQPFFFLIV